MTMLLGHHPFHSSFRGHYPFPSSFQGHYTFPSSFQGSTLLGSPTLDAGNVNWSALWPKVAGTLTLASAAASAYHGYKRNDSIGWSLWWFTMGVLFPVVTPVIGVAQGFAKPKK